MHSQLHKHFPAIPVCLFNDRLVLSGRPIFNIAINSIHNLSREPLKAALKEVVRVSRGHSYITVDAWRNEEERENLYKWVLTAETMMHVDDWKKLFDEVGYTGDYWWFIAD